MASPAQIKKFIAQIMPIAQQVGSQYGISPSVIAAQAALESGYGTSSPGNEYFGIKGEGQTLATHEQGANGLYGTSDSFRAYPNLAAAADDYGSLLARRYPGAVAAATPQEAFSALQNEGYATDNDYAGKLGGTLSVLERYGFEPSAAPDESAYAAPVTPAATPADLAIQRALFSAANEPTMTTDNGDTYNVGQTYTLSDGATFRANPDGTFTKTASTPRSPTLIQLYLESQTPEAQANLAKVGSAANTVKDAAQNALGFLGGIFSGGNATPATAPPSLVASVPQQVSYDNAGDSLAFAPDVLGFTADLNQPDRGYTGPAFDTSAFNDDGFILPSAMNGSGSPDDRDSGAYASQSAPQAVALPMAQSSDHAIASDEGEPPSLLFTGNGIAGTVQMPQGARPAILSSLMPQDYSPPTAQDQDASEYTPDDPSYEQSGWSLYSPDLSPGADLDSLSVAASSVPKYISVAQRVPVAGVDPAGDAESGVAWNADTGQFEMAAPKPAAPASRTVYVQKPNPAYHPAQPAVVSHPMMAAVAPQPVGAPNGYVYQRNAQGGYTNVGQVNPKLTPAQVYSIAASAALNDGNPDGSAGMSTGRSTYNSVGVANSLV